MTNTNQDRVERLAAHWDATDAPDIDYTAVTEPVSDPMVVYSLRLPRAIADQLRQAAEDRGMPTGELAREWISGRLQMGHHPTAVDLAGQLETLAARLRSS